MDRRSPPSVAFHDVEEPTNNLITQQAEPRSLRESAIPVSPRTSFSSPRVITPATATAPLAPRRPEPVTIPLASSSHRQPQPTPPAAFTFPSPNPPPATIRSPPPPPRSAMPPPRPARPDEGERRYNPGWTHPFPSSQIGGTAPPRPARPARPAEALMFAAPRPAFADTSFPRTPEQNDGFEGEGLDLATFVEQEQPPEPVSPPLASPDSLRKNPSHRKPVPRFIASEPTTPGRLSVGGFEALLAKGEKRSALEPISSDPGLKRRLEDEKPFSPRLGLGLDEGGVEARKQRLARDEARSGPAVVGPAMARGISGDIGEENLSWSDRLRQSEWMPSAFAKRPAASNIPPPSLQAIGRHDSWRADGPPTAAIIHAYSHSRNPSTNAFRPVQADNTPSQPRRRSTVAMSRRRSEATEKDLQEVVVIPSAWDDDTDDEDEMKAREATFQPERMSFDRVEYRNWFPKLVHTFYPFFVLFHYPATLFLDYNIIYTLVQIAIYPTFPSTSPNLVSRATIDVPTLQASTAYWVAVGAYSLCTLIWFVVISLWFDLVVAYIKPWSIGGRVPIARVYRGASSFNFACMSSYSRFCFLWRVRLAPFQKRSALARTVRGTRKSDGVAETCSWYSQNWPTVLLLLPRAGLSLAILLLFGTTAYGGPNENATQRDSAYFQRNGTLTGFAQGVLLTNCAWAAYRLALVVASAMGLFVFNKPLRARNEAFSSYYHPSREHLTIPTTPSDFDEKRHGDRRRSGVPGWKLRRDRRLRAATLSCLRISTQSSPAFSPRFEQKEQQQPSTTRRVEQDRDLQRDERKQQREQKRLARLAVQGIDWQQGEEPIRPDVPQHNSQGGWGVVSPYVLPTPRMGSPLMTFSPASPPSEYPETPALPSHRNGREVRTIPVQRGLDQPDEDDNAAEELRDVHFNSRHPRSPPPRPLSLRVDSIAPFAPELQSRFSFTSMDTGAGTPPASNTAATTPAFTRPLSTEAIPPFTPRDLPSSQDDQEETIVFPRHPSLVVQPASPPRSSSISTVRDPQPQPPSPSTPPRPDSTLTLGDRPSPSDVRYAVRHEVLQRQLTQGVIERRLLSEKLLVEVQRLGEAEEAVRREERRLATLRRISEAPSTSADSLTSYTTARNDPTHLSMISTGTSEDLGLSEAPGLLLPPFRLSYGLNGGGETSHSLPSDLSTPVSPNLEGEEFGVAVPRAPEHESTTAAFLSPTSSSSSSSDNEDEGDHSLTPRATIRSATTGGRRGFTVYGGAPSPGGYSAEAGGGGGEGQDSPGVGAAREERDQWTWRTSLRPLPRSE